MEKRLPVTWTSVRPEKGFYSACEDLQPTRAFVVYGGQERYAIADGVEAIGLREMAEMLKSL